MDPIDISILFHHHLRPLLHLAYRQDGSVLLSVKPGTTIKDAVESLRVPHPEVGKLLVNHRLVGFSYQLRAGDRVKVLPLEPPVDPTTPTLLRPEVSGLRFMADVNVARLGTLLRMVGIDAACRLDLGDTNIAAKAVREERILLSRDRGLLKRKIVGHGHLVRSQLPDEQLAEVVGLYGLWDLLHPFSRCMQCNTLLVAVDKGVILDRLEPLTRKYFQTFYLCPSCDKIYWDGSHKEGMNRLLATLLSNEAR